MPKIRTLRYKRDHITEVHSINYQRNGVAGVGFYVVRFDWRDDDGKLRRMIGHVHPACDHDGNETRPEYYGVTDIDEPTECWRGDHFVDELHKAITAHNAKRYAELGLSPRQPVPAD
jgi:hypothetical protein